MRSRCRYFVVFYYIFALVFLYSKWMEESIFSWLFYVYGCIYGCAIFYVLTVNSTLQFVHFYICKCCFTFLLKIIFSWLRRIYPYNIHISHMKWIRCGRASHIHRHIELIHVQSEPTENWEILYLYQQRG